jgi:hypothetical protein
MVDGTRSRNQPEQNQSMNSMNINAQPEAPHAGSASLRSRRTLIKRFSVKKLLVAVLGLVFAASPLHAEEPAKRPTVTKDSCIALFQQVVKDVNQGKFDKVFTNIADDRGGHFKIMKPGDLESMKKDDGEDWARRNFRKYDEIEAIFDKIAYREFVQVLDPACEVKSGDQSSEGVRYMLVISPPGGGEKTFLNFVEFEGRLYWIPMGW